MAASERERRAIERVIEAEFEARLAAADRLAEAVDTQVTPSFIDRERKHLEAGGTCGCDPNGNCHFHRYERLAAALAEYRKAGK